MPLWKVTCNYGYSSVILLFLSFIGDNNFFEEGWGFDAKPTKFSFIKFHSMLDLIKFQESHVTGGIIEMRLMKRERNSLFAVPVSHPGLPTHPSLQDTPQNQALGKIIKVNKHLFWPLERYWNQ